MTEVMLFPLRQLLREGSVLTLGTTHGQFSFPCSVRSRVAASKRGCLVEVGSIWHNGVVWCYESSGLQRLHTSTYDT